MTPMTLQASAWNEAAKPKSLPEGLYNKIADNQQLLQKILQLSQAEVENTINAFKNPAELEQVLRALVNRGFIITDQNTEDLTKFKQNLADVFEIGLNTGTTTPPAASAIVQTTMVDSVMQLVTQMDTDLKKSVGKILADGYAQKKFPVDIVKQMSNEIGISQERARKIATTETMRGSNAASWTQNHSEGMKYFVVDHRSAACKRCIREFSGRVFKITETRYIPPIHPFCACVPIFFATKAEAQKYAKRIQKRNNLERAELKKQGFTLPKDGTGPNLTGNEQAKIIKQVEKEQPKINKTPKPKTPNPNNIPSKSLPDDYKLISQDNKFKSESVVARGRRGSIKEGVFRKYYYSDGIDDITILFKKGLPLKFQQPEEILKAYKTLSPTLKDSINRIVAIGSKGNTLGYNVGLINDDIYIAPRAIGENYAKLRHTISHESTHAWEGQFRPKLIGNRIVRPEKPFDWVDIMIEERTTGKPMFCSDYARSTGKPSEDLAESGALYNADPKKFKKDFPRRYEALKKVM